MKYFCITSLLFTLSFVAYAAEVPSVHITPTNILQGDPVLVTVIGTTSLPIKSTPSLFFFLYKGIPSALYGSDINQKVGTTTITLTLKDGSEVSGSFFIAARTRPQESFPVPEKLGGNSTSSQKIFVSKLSVENTELAHMYSRKDKVLWTKVFSYPVGSPITITDPYGYNRDSGAATITHKGVDFHAPVGTKTYAINRGIVRAAKGYTVYGKTVILDHGLGLLSMYMHLSKIFVAQGELVQAGQLIGLSGETGYSEGPHLHLTVRIDGVSIDPMQFFKLFGLK